MHGFGLHRNSVVELVQAVRRGPGPGSYLLLLVESRGVMRTSEQDMVENQSFRTDDTSGAVKCRWDDLEERSEVERCCELRLSSNILITRP